MGKSCKNCKFYNVDYEWDDELEDEVEIRVCRKRHRLFLNLPFKCPYFKKYEPKPYVEKFTKCDKCEYIKDCENEGNVINCTKRIDNHEHFIRGMNAYCRKESGLLEDKKLSEIIEISEKLNCLDLENCKEFFRKAIKRFGDIPYKEFVKEKIFEMYED